MFIFGSIALHLTPI